MRPAPAPIDPSSEAILFQQLECDFTSGQPHRVHYLGGGAVRRCLFVSRVLQSACVYSLPSVGIWGVL